MRTAEQADPGSRGSWSIRARLGLLLALPTAALLVVAGVGVTSQAADVSRVDDTVASVRLILSTQDVVHELQRERGLSTGFVAGENRFRTQLDQERGRTDRVRATWEQQLDQTAAGRAVAAASGRLRDLASVRQRVDQRAIDPPQTVGFFTALIGDLSTAADRQQVGYADPEIQRGLTALRTISDAKEATGQERAIGNGIFVANRFLGRSYRAFSEVDARRKAGFDTFGTVASPPEQDSLRAALASPAGTTVVGIMGQALDSPVSPALGVGAPQWYDTMTSFIDELRTTQQLVGTGIQTRADALQSDARTLLALFVVLALLALAGIVVLAVAAARAIVRPVTRLADHADDVARRWLPQAVARIQASGGGAVPALPDVPLPTGDRGAREIVDLSRALENVQRTALQLAGEQSVIRHNTATSLGALGRRNQNLVRRQLALIDELEHDESDPDVLASLFTLDHLATRMRRNAESVLVLVGERATRRWSSAVPVDDVVRAAVSEVEDYPRVQLGALERSAVTGAAAADVTHVVAELLENALSFSPPDRPVELHGQKVDAGYLIAIVDHGTGMDDASLSTANERVRAGEGFLVAPTRFLGHYVVGTLAGRLGVDVHLQRSPLTGLTARILVPASLLVAPGAVEPVAVGGPPPSPRADVEPGMVAVRERPRPTDGVGEPPVAGDTTATDITEADTTGATGTPETPEPEPADPEPSVAAPTGGPAAVTPRTTRNGLVKRVRGTPGSSGAGGGGRSAVRPEPTGPAHRGRTAPAVGPADRPPERVRSMLGDFRKGYQGAASGGPGDGATGTSTGTTDGAAPQLVEEGR